MRVLLTSLSLVALSVTGCGDDDHHGSIPAECQEIIDVCHPLDPGSGPINECHENAESGTAESCATSRNECLTMICVAPGDAG